MAENSNFGRPYGHAEKSLSSFEIGMQSLLQELSISELVDFDPENTQATVSDLVQYYGELALYVNVSSEFTYILKDKIYSKNNVSLINETEDDDIIYKRQILARRAILALGDFAPKAFKDPLVQKIVEQELHSNWKHPRDIAKLVFDMFGEKGININLQIDVRRELEKIMSEL
ncbi:hypothetical protein COV24_02715 [candidate division WWE3 bacterium CG10_big_fil_rev_8_21_14_0_10_32_10]|uniref:Uncharacterized protein n=1 Tax=candidate division WWE3 bacterium CG10_big_fil_rev_8_21_14_0_10_32_10 TaxID=1975090 RepID=A0A2H0RA75_UNCKA|nr:MAG: hypothetical protein COV24_02715 [candidate division WWE3 bacterium CG10_big_fil_rev_8_21_14_0_10_32_10]